MNMWDHLPNARYIDWVLQSVRQYTDQWSEARYAVMGVGMGTLRRVAYDAAWSAGHVARGGDTIQNVAYEAARPDWPSESVALSSHGAWEAAGGATLALVAYDDCAHLLYMSSEKLRAWAVLSEQPAAVLLLPAVIARELI